MDDAILLDKVGVDDSILLEEVGVDDATIGSCLGALKSMSLSCKYGMFCTGAGISHLFSSDVHGVSL